MKTKGIVGMTALLQQVLQKHRLRQRFSHKPDWFLPRYDTEHKIIGLDYFWISQQQPRKRIMTGSILNSNCSTIKNKIMFKAKVFEKTGERKKIILKGLC